MIFLVQFGINKYLYIFKRPQIVLALRACAILLVFEKFIPNSTRNHVITVLMQNLINLRIWAEFIFLAAAATCFTIGNIRS